MKPYRIFLFFCGIFILTGLLSLITPVKGIHLGPGLDIRIPSISGLFHQPSSNYADITELSKVDKADSVVALRSVTSGDTIVHPRVDRFLEYPDSSKSALDPFFRKLADLGTSKESIHILHYGDSQLEADHISGYLRFRFQDEFGGNGPGLLSLDPEISRISLQITASGNWNRTSLIGSTCNLRGKRSFGALASYSRFMPVQDSIPRIQEKQVAWIKIAGTGQSYGKSQNFSRCRIFYANNRAPVMARFFSGDQPVKTDTLEPGMNLGMTECRFEHLPSEMRVELSGTDSPDFFGISLDGAAGVSVDNIPLRGSSGMEFTRMDPVILAGMLERLNARLLILQFGVNAIPGNLSDYSYYEAGLKRQLAALKKLNPELCIIVIGVSDASQKVDDRYETYPSVEKIAAAEKSAALKTGCVYWDLYQAMGGKNSMPSWVLAKEPLASTDFLHFNYKGASVVAKMFYSALIHDYNEFLIRRR